jgi:glucose/arabinose dehydrogenase
MRRLLPLLAALGLLVAACADDGEDLPSDTRAPVVEDPTVPTTAPPVTTGDSVPDATSLDGVEVATELVGEFQEPIAMAGRPGDTDGRVYLAERAGRVRDLSLTDGSSEVVLDIRDQTTTDAERGLLGLAVAPDGSQLYVSYTNRDGDSRVDAYDLAEDGALDVDSRRIVFALDQPFPNHNGGHLTFGPDGFLYLGFGDGGDSGDPLLAGQDRGQLLGSLLRIDPRGSDGSAYAVPSSNPYVGHEGARPEVWLKGVRNPWRFSFDRLTGDLWIGDVGQNEVEEIDWLPAEDGVDAGRGANLGWNEMEGDVPFEDGVEPDDHTPPVLTYRHADGGCSVTGGHVYRGTAITGLYGAYLYADYCIGELRALTLDRETGEVLDDAALLAEPLSQPVSFAEDAAGEHYVLLQSGRLLRLTPA